MIVTMAAQNQLSSSVQEKFQHLWRLVGHTPMVAIEYRYKGKVGKVYAKCEQFNLTGSIKDRMALFILEEAYNQGLLKPGDRIVESTSGNTGIALAAIGNALGHPVTIVLPDWLSSERIAILHSLGAKVVTVSRKQGGFLGSIRMAEEMAAHNKNVFLPRQFDNYHNARAHEYTTAREIWSQLQQVDQPVSAFVAGVGTGGTIMGVGRFLKSKNPQIKVHPIEPLESPT